MGSMPLTQAMLEGVKEKINSYNFNWLLISIWFGLRPLEVDNLKKDGYWRIEQFPDGTNILWVYQTKIISVPEEQRWKPIPILYLEQKALIEILETRKFKRPLNKTMNAHFGKEVRLYGGRKGFVDLMLSKGERIENISIWMGHSTLGRTWRHYKQMRAFHLKTERREIA